MAPVLAIASLLAFLKQTSEDCLDGSSMVRIRLVESHHVDEDDVALVHKEVAEEIERFRLAYPVSRQPIQLDQ
jgi:hypothetical protein